MKRKPEVAQKYEMESAGEMGVPHEMPSTYTSKTLAQMSPLASH